MVVRAHGSERCQRFLQGAVRLNKAGVERVQQTAAAVAMPTAISGATPTSHCWCHNSGGRQ